MTISRHGARDPSSAWLSTTLVRRAAVAAALGVAAACVVALLRWTQLPATPGPLGMSTSGAGAGLWIVLGAVPGAAIGLLGPATPTTAVARGLVVGLLWWIPSSTPVVARTRCGRP